MDTSKKIGFDKDFLWLFRKIKHPAICISLDHRIIEVNPATEVLFAVLRKKILYKSTSFLFEQIGLIIAFLKNKKKHAVKISVNKNTKNTINPHTQKILNLNWKIKPKNISNDKLIGFIIYAEEQPDSKYLTQTIAGQKKSSHRKSITDNAKYVKTYLENIIACMPGNIYWMDKNCIYLGCNDNVAKFSGLKSRKEIVGLTYEDIEKKARWITGHTASWKRDDLEVISTGKALLNVEEKPVLLPNGKEIFYLTSRVPLFDNKKNVIGVVGISLDITDRKLMEQKLQLAQKRAEKAEKESLIKINKEVTGQQLDFDIKKSPVEYAKTIKVYFENIISNMPGNIYWMDKNCMYLGCNDNVMKLLSASSKKDIIGKTYEDFEKIGKLAPGQTETFKRDDLEVITSGKPKLNIEEPPILLPDGNKVYYLTNRAPIFDDKKNVIGVVGVSIDISDRKRAEKLQTEKEVAEKTSRLMQKLAGSIAHEVRTPLAIIGVNIDLLERTQFFASENDEKTKEKYIKTIKYAIRLASRIIDDILVMIRTLSASKPFNSDFKYLSIAESIRDVLEIYPFLNHEKTLIHLENMSKDFIYYGDKILTQHMLFNLIKNALFSIKEADKGDITIKLETGKSENTLIFTDTALGISKEYLPKIFEQFETKKDAGFGLGLAFCKMVMQFYGGDISCTSELGKYATFTLSFPVPSTSNIKNTKN